LTTDNASPANANGEDAYDIDLSYRAYSMTTGWLWQKAGADETTEPGLIHFDPMEVDFATFLSAQATYDGAMSGLVYAGTGIVAAVLAITF